MFELGLFIFLFSCGLLFLLCVLIVIYTSVHTYTLMNKDKKDTE